MASDESMTLRSCISMQEGEYDDYTDEGYDQDQPHQHLSRLSMCTSNSIYGDDQMNDDGGNVNSIYYQGQQENGMSLYMSLLSIDSFDGDGDVDEEEESSNKKRLSSQLVLAAGMSTDDDSDTEPACFSLPATPPRLRRDLPGARGAGSILINKVHPYSRVDKEYASENEAQKALSDDCRRSRRRSRRRMMRNRSSWLSPSPFHHGAKTTPDSDDDGEDEDKEEEEEEEEEESTYMNVCGDHCHSFSGESEGTGMVVIARPKGGNRSLCMDMEEVKACKDLGFELEHDRILQQQQEMIPSRLSLSSTTLDTNYTTSSGGTSPIANWPISSPGDHPQEVKARLKAWAQAVALASAPPTRHSS